MQQRKKTRIKEKKQWTHGRDKRSWRRPPADLYQQHPSTGRARGETKKRTFDHDVDRVWKKKEKGGQHSAFDTRREHDDTDDTTHKTPHAPLSSISSDAGVSSSLILVPSYKNLCVSVCQRLSRRTRVVRALRKEKRAPDARHVLAHLARISALQLAQLCIPLDFEKDFVPCRADDLRARACAGRSASTTPPPLESKHTP
jgi:hypothetical protein